jgi:hypothetical protein
MLDSGMSSRTTKELANLLSISATNVLSGGPDTWSVSDLPKRRKCMADGSTKLLGSLGVPILRGTEHDLARRSDIKNAILY